MTRRAHRDSTVCAVMDIRPVSGSRGAAHTMPCQAIVEDHVLMNRSYACRIATIPVLRGTILSHGNISRTLGSASWSVAWNSPTPRMTRENWTPDNGSGAWVMIVGSPNWYMTGQYVYRTGVSGTNTGSFSDSAASSND